MLDTVKGKRMVECDSCNSTIEQEDGGSFTDFIFTIKESGWKVKKLGSNWIHTCPDCQ